MPGDEAAFAAVFEAERRPVYAFLLGRLGEPDTARDLTQETFLRAWRRFAELRDLPDHRRRAWLFTVARNLLTDTYRSRATRTATVRALGETASEAAPAGERPDLRAETGDRVARVGAAIRALPDELREVVALHAAGELTSAQIGAALGRPAGTVRYQLAQARRRLAESLDLTTPQEVGT